MNHATDDSRPAAVSRTMRAPLGCVAAFLGGKRHLTHIALDVSRTGLALAFATALGSAPPQPERLAGALAGLANPLAPTAL